MRFNESPERPRPECFRTASRRRSCTPRSAWRGVPLMASDGCNQTSKFEGLRLALTVPSEAEARQAFDALSDGGSVQMPLQEDLLVAMLRHGDRPVRSRMDGHGARFSRVTNREAT